MFEDGFSTQGATGVTDYALKGKSVPDFPEIAVQAGVTFEPVEWAVINLSARHISDRYSNFMNNEKTKGYTLFNMYVDLGEGFNYGPLKDIKARINVDNIFDKDYLGTNSTVVTGAANYRPGPHRTAQITLSAGF